MQDRISVALSIVRRLGALAITFVPLIVWPARADVRVALVVGVSAYVNVPVLRNTTNDATAVGAAWGFYAANRGAAETLALEGCQQSYGSPCILLAVGTDLRAPDPATAPKHDMARLHATGPFSPENVPFVTASSIPDLLKYSSLPGRKAIAIRAVSTRVNIVSGAASIADAERQALAACNNDPELAFPCFIYASGDRVVLPERRTEAAP